MSSTLALEVHDLRKRFGEVQAVDGLSFDVRSGEVFGFLGPNGAGKTTTISMLTGLARPDAGTIRIAGRDCTRNPKAAQDLIGVIPDTSNLYPELTGFDNLCFCGALYGMGKAQRQARARELLEAFGLAGAASRKFGGYSRGMKRKLTIAAGILHRPPVLFLDEPTTGIDVASARQIRGLLADLHQRGTTVFLTTHYIEEAERLCDRIAFIVSGRIVQTGALADLLRPLEGKHSVSLSFETAQPDARDALAGAFPDLEFHSPSDRQVRAESGKPMKLSALVGFLEGRGVAVVGARADRLGLEEVFLRATGLEAQAMSSEKERARGGAA